MKVSPWIVVDGYCAARIVEGGDVNKTADRVAFIEKTPRVRMKPFDGEAGSLFESNDNWHCGPKGCGGADGDNPDNELYGFYPPSREWCDNALRKMGYELPEDQKRKVKGLVVETVIVQKYVDVEVSVDADEEEIAQAIRDKAYEQTIFCESDKHGWDGVETQEVNVYELDEEGKAQCL